MSRGQLEAALDDEITDANEETFSLFAAPIPSQNLGFVDATAQMIEVEINGRDFTIVQSPGLLRSDQKSGTTGAVLWKISPLVADWIVSQSGLLWSTSILHSQAKVIELGCGISGLLGLCLSPFLSQYLLTDQAHVLKHLKTNLKANQPRHPPALRKIDTLKRSAGETGQLLSLPLDWEHDSVQNIGRCLDQDAPIDLILACDCIYNEFLIEPFNNICFEICNAYSADGRTPVLLVAQQLRSEAIFEDWLESAMKYFHIWRLPDKYLTAELRSGSGYALHLAFLRV